MSVFYISYEDSVNLPLVTQLINRDRNFKNPSFQNSNFDFM